MSTVTVPTESPAPSTAAAARIPAAWRWGAISIAAAVALGLPLVARSFVVFQVTMALIYAIAILGLDLLTGISGQFSLGHSAFFGLGAYATAILMEGHGVPYLLALPLAAMASFAFGFLFRLPAARLEGVYLALATFALAVATPQILKSTPLEPWTGGVQGIVVTKPDAPLGLPLSPDQWLYYLSLAILLALAACALNLVRSRTGRALLALRDHPTAAASMGVDVVRYKSVVFGVSAMYAGVAGGLSAIAVQFIAPDSFTFALSVALFLGLVVGGVGSIWGALVGGLFILFVPNVAERLSKDLAGAMYGVILLAVIYAMPSGVAGLARRTLGRWKR
jgi:branched-chain amino acid transport system permease protein